MKFGIIGCGHMAGIILDKMINNGIVNAVDVKVSVKHEYRRKELSEKYDVTVCNNNREVAEGSDYLLIGIKPQDFETVISEIRDHVNRDTVFISMAVGISIKKICEYLGYEAKVIRIMPNLPAQVGEGVTGYCQAGPVSENELKTCVGFLESFGQAIRVHEEDMDIVSSIASAAPAFIYILIEALADGAVAEGLKRDLAYRFASQMVLGTGKLVRDSGVHPGTLKDGVCSPGGTTIEGVSILEEKGFRSAVIEATRACVKKSRILSGD